MLETLCFLLDMRRDGFDLMLRHLRVRLAGRRALSWSRIKVSIAATISRLLMMAVLRRSARVEGLAGMIVLIVANVNSNSMP